MNKIIKNSMITPDGTEIISKYKHDFLCHTDANGKTYCVDGGHDYLRRVGDIEDCIDTSITTDNKHEDIRSAFQWTSYGKDGKSKAKLTFLKDLDIEHIKAIILTQTHLSVELLTVFKNELKYRKGKL